MKLSVEWLRDYIDFDCPADELAVKLTMAGLEVEDSKRWSKRDFVDAGGAGLNDDVVWDVKVTPNRGDWLSMIGVARECGPIVGGRMRLPAIKLTESAPKSSDLVKISIDAPDLCRRYVGVVVRNAAIKESPGWMKDRLIAAGMRPINNVVDVTNYVMLELGQPLHAFDLSLLHGRRIIVRRARPGEWLTSLDDVRRDLEPEMLVIADADRAVALAGVMGGADSQISGQTEDILIESANFRSNSIRRSAKRLSMVTESSYRFERSVDPAITAFAAQRAAALIQELAGGEIAEGVVDVCPEHAEPWTLEVRPERVNAVLGASIDAADMASHLNSLEIETSISGGKLICQVPTFRPDVTREIDVIEEIGRVHGYDNLAVSLPKQSMQGKDSPEGVFREKVRRALISCGAQEALTHSLVDSALAEVAGKFETRVVIRNPLTADLDSMRVALIPNLLQVLQRNQAVGIGSLSVFEIGCLYLQNADKTDEKLSVAGAMAGDLWAGKWALPAKALEVDFYLCKGMVESLLSELDVCGARFEAVDEALFHATRAARILVGGREVGMLGEVAPEVLDKLDVKGRACAFELDFGALMACAPVVSLYSELPRYPATERHMAVVVAGSVSYEQMERAVLSAGGMMVERVELLDEYRGEHIAADQSSLTLSVTFRSAERTLKDEEVNTLLVNIKEALARDLSASFR